MGQTENLHLSALAIRSFIDGKSSIRVLELAEQLVAPWTDYQDPQYEIHDELAKMIDIKFCFKCGRKYKQSDKHCSSCNELLRG